MHDKYNGMWSALQGSVPCILFFWFCMGHKSSFFLQIEKGVSEYVGKKV